MGTGIYSSVKATEAGLGEVGMINSRAKLERAKKRNRNVSERKGHVKKSAKRNRPLGWDDFDDEDYMF